MSRLAGKVALITGAGTGIGRAAALRFSQEGAAVVLAEIDGGLGLEAERAVREAGGEVLFVQTDVTDESSVQRAVRSTLDRYSKLDVLYNCAGGSVPEDCPTTELDLSVWDHTLSLDLKGTLLCCRHAIPPMQRGGGGSIINMASVAALRGVHHHAYAAAKGGIVTLTRSLAFVYSKDLIRVNAICPGLALSDRARERHGSLDDPHSTASHLASAYPFAVGAPVDIANVALFLASDESRMVNAVILPAEGGMSVY